MHIPLYELLGRGGRSLAPELVDEACRRDGLVRMQEQHTEQRPLLRGAQPNGLSPASNLEWTEDPVLQSNRPFSDETTVPPASTDSPPQLQPASNGLPQRGTDVQHHTRGGRR